MDRYHRADKLPKYPEDEEEAETAHDKPLASENSGGCSRMNGNSNFIRISLPWWQYNHLPASSVLRLRVRKSARKGILGNIIELLTHGDYGLGFSLLNGGRACLDRRFRLGTRV